MSKQIEINPGDNILISRSDKLGDLILALPFVETIKVRYPECQVDVLTSLYASPILENNPSIDRIVRVQNDQLLIDKLYKKDLLYRIRQGNYKIVVALYPERQISRLFYKAEIPTRIGTSGRFHSMFFNIHLFHSRKSNKKHEYEYNLDFLQFFKYGETRYTPKVYLVEKEINNAKRILSNVGVNDKFIVLHPGTRGSAEKWPIESFLDLYQELDKSGLDVVISGSEAEGAKVVEVAKQKRIKIRDITGETDLRTLAAVLSLATVVVANSTGPLHLSAAVGTKVVGLYPVKKVMSPRRWGPVGRYHKVIQPPLQFCQCSKGQCKCMESIEVNNVLEQVIETFNLTTV